MAVNPQDEHHIFQCRECGTNIQGAHQYRNHMRNVLHPGPHRCGECDLEYEHFTSLMRHIRDSHYAAIEPNVGDVPLDGGDNVLLNMEIDEDAGSGEEAVGGEVLANAPLDESDSSDEDIENLARSAGQMVLNLRQTGNITGSSIERFQDEAFSMIKVVTKSIKKKVKTFLVDHDMFTPEARDMLREIVAEDPFKHIRTLKQQLNYFATEFGMVKPESKFLGYRYDYRLNPQTAQFEPARVPMSFEYVSIIKTLIALVNNAAVRDLIRAEKPSEDGVLRCYLDGTRAKEHPLIGRFPQILRIQLYWDDVEVVNPLGSKTSVHKLAAFYFSVQNLPAIEKGQLSSVYLLALAYSQDMKGPGCVERILAPFLYELRKLESDQGVMVQVDGQPYCLRATLTMLCADTLAAHEILGFLSPSARCFCRRCMICRPDFQRDLNAMGEKRTRAMFDEHVRMVQVNKRYSTECGVRTSCPLHVSKNFNATEDAIFDVLHDLLEGVCHWVISLSLRSFITSEYFTLDDFNARLTAFNYGIPDAKNKPSANFSVDSLKGSKLKQKGSQMWCLTRIFGFIVSDVPEGNPHLKLVNLLQQIMLIVFAEEVRPEDTLLVDRLVEQHHKLFQELHMTEEANVLDELIDSEDEGMADDPGTQEQPNVNRATQWKKVQPGNKLHHMKHYGELLRQFGGLILYWCMRYEARHHIFCKYGAVCCNFINIVKSMAQMFQISTLAGLLKTSSRAEDVECQSPCETTVDQCSHKDLLLGMGLRLTDIVVDVDAVKIAGEDYRPGLFVITEANGPTFALIRQVYKYNDEVLFVLRQWQTIQFRERYCAFEVKPSVVYQPIVMTHKSLPRHGAYALWNPWNQRSTFIAPRTILF